MLSDSESEELLQHTRIQTQLLSRLVELIGKQEEPNTNPYVSWNIAPLKMDDNHPELIQMKDELNGKRSTLFRLRFYNQYKNSLDFQTIDSLIVTELEIAIRDLQNEYNERKKQLEESGELKTYE